MKKMHKSRSSGLTVVVLPACLLLMMGCEPRFTIQEYGDYSIVNNEKGQVLGYAPGSGITVITHRRQAFKDLNRNEVLDPYEDWRLPARERAEDLAGRMTVEQIAGLMLYSGHQSVPSQGGGFFGGTYTGQPYDRSGAHPYDLTDQQKDFLTADHVRHVLVTSVQSPAVAARWNNNLQKLSEGTGMGIPVNISSDPRHSAVSNAEYNAGAGGDISMWPRSTGIAASFDPELMKQFGEIASREYRALGIATALSPQIDLASEPRWSRFNATMGEDPGLASDMARAYVDGFQGSEGDDEISGGWGYSSVNAMVKHWPGGGTGEGGRDAHFGYGAYGVFPGNNLKDHLKPFTEGAFKLEGPTGKASAVMPYYTISYELDTIHHENVGNAYSRYFITDLLREEYGYDGVVCTDWGITGDAQSVYEFQGKSWGVEELSLPGRHYKAIMAGVDQFGGNNDMDPVLEAYRLGVEEYGEEFMRDRFEQSAVRLLMNMFRVGLFENPYLDPEVTGKVVGNPTHMEAGYKAQLRSIVMLKNAGMVLPVSDRVKAYIPRRYVPGGRNWFGREIPARWEMPVDPEIAARYFEVVESAGEAEIALVGIESPAGGTGYDVADREAGGNGYLPITLQYGPYTAGYARETSLAGGSPFEDFTNRSYHGKTVTASNVSDMELVRKTRQEMGKKPVIVIIDLSNPMVFSEIEPYADALLVHMGVQDQAILDIVSGHAEPSALLPFQMPASMRTVEEQYEDVSHDMKVYTDSEGHAYDFAYGMNWNGVLGDERVTDYRKAGTR
jgi:beta-glucosidase